MNKEQEDLLDIAERLEITKQELRGELMIKKGAFLAMVSMQLRFATDLAEKVEEMAKGAGVSTSKLARRKAKGRVR